jgi:hypothetical protein
MTVSSFGVVAASLLAVAAFAAGYFLHGLPRYPLVVKLARPLELSTGLQEGCTLPSGTELEYDGTLGGEGVSRYRLYVNVKAGYLPEPVQASHRGYKSPISAIERWDQK